MCNINLFNLLTGADIGGTWSQLSGPSTISISNGSINTDGITVGTYVFQYSITACGDTSTSQVTINIEQGAENVSTDICLSGTYNLLTLINAELGTNFINTGNASQFEITFNTGSPTSTHIQLAVPFNINAASLLPNSYVIKIKRILDSDGNPMWNQCPCEFLFTINAVGCTPLSLNIVNNCTLGIAGSCNPATAMLQKLVNNIWTDVQNVNVPSQYALLPGTGGTYRLKHEAGSCTEYSSERTLTCPCSECDYVVTFPTGSNPTDGSGALIKAIYRLVNNVPTLIALPNYPYGPNSVGLQQDLQAYENANNTGGTVTVTLSDNCISRLTITDTCNRYSYVEGPSGVCGSSFDLNCIDFVSGFVSTASCGSTTPYYTMDVYPELQSGTNCIILINKKRVDTQIGYITRLRKVGTTNIIVANVNTLPVHNTTHYKYDAQAVNGGSGNGTYYTETVRTSGTPNSIESCTEVVVTNCNCIDCGPIAIQYNAQCGNVTVTSNCSNTGNYTLRIEYSVTQSPFIPTTWTDYPPSVWTAPSYTFNLFSPPIGTYFRAKLISPTNGCPQPTSNILPYTCACTCSVSLSLNPTTCVLSWTSTCSTYNLQLERFVVSNWQVVGGAASPFPVVIDGQYRVRASKAGCNDVISSTVTTNCACSSPILTVSGAAAFQYDCNNIGYYYADVYPTASSITITSSHPVTWSFNRLTPTPTNINIVSSTSTSFTFIPTNVSYSCPYTYDNGCYTIDSGDWGYEFIATRSCGDFEKIVIEAYCL